MKATTLVGLILISSTFTGCKAGTVPLLGYNKQGKVIQAFVDKDQYIRRFKNGVVDLNESMAPMLNDKDGAPEKKWQLQLVVVGVGLQASVGFGPFKMGISPGIRAIFTNQTTPPPLP